MFLLPKVKSKVSFTDILYIQCRWHIVYIFKNVQCVILSSCRLGTASVGLLYKQPWKCTLSWSADTSWARRWASLAWKDEGRGEEALLWHWGNCNDRIPMETWLKSIKYDLKAKNLLTPGSRTRTHDRSTCHSLCGKCPLVCSACLYVNRCLWREWELCVHIIALIFITWKNRNIHIFTGSYIKTDSTKQFMKPFCKRSGKRPFLQAVSTIHRGMPVTLRKQSIGTHWYAVKSPGGLNARSGYRGHSLQSASWGWFYGHKSQHKCRFTLHGTKPRTGLACTHTHTHII